MWILLSLWQNHPLFRQHEHAAVDAVIAARRAVLLFQIRFTLLLAFVASNDGRAQHFWPFWPITIKPCLRFPGKSGKIREGPDLRRKYLTSSLLENVVLMAGFFTVGLRLNCFNNVPGCFSLHPRLVQWPSFPFHARGLGFKPSSFIVIRIKAAVSSCGWTVLVK